MATEEDELKTGQQAQVRLARGTTPLISENGATIAAGAVTTFPTIDPIDTTNHKRIVARLAHDSDFTDGKLTIEFSDTEDFTNITFFETINLNITTNPTMIKTGATPGLDETFYIADMDVESMGKYMRAKVRNDTLATRTYDLNIRGKVN